MVKNENTEYQLTVG